jgi:hypothetical protein
MTREPLPLGVPDTYALRRRVLLVGAVSLLLFLVVSYTIAWLGISDAWLLVALALIYLLVVRPLMKPVRDALALRRRLAYDAYRGERQGKDGA